MVEDFFGLLTQIKQMWPEIDLLKIIVLIFLVEVVKALFSSRVSAKALNQIKYLAPVLLGIGLEFLETAGVTKSGALFRATLKNGIILGAATGFLYSYVLRSVLVKLGLKSDSDSGGSAEGGSAETETKTDETI